MEGAGKQGQSNKKKYFCFSKLLGAKGLEPGRKRLVAGESSREITWVQMNAVSIQIQGKT